jgi:hypothetical protein
MTTAVGVGAGIRVGVGMGIVDVGRAVGVAEEHAAINRRAVPSTAIGIIRLAEHRSMASPLLALNPAPRAAIYVVAATNAAAAPER